MCYTATVNCTDCYRVYSTAGQPLVIKQSKRPIFINRPGLPVLRTFVLGRFIKKKTLSLSIPIVVCVHNIYNICGIRLTGRISYHTRVCDNDNNGWVEKDPIDQNVMYVMYIY